MLSQTKEGAFPQPSLSSSLIKASSLIEAIDGSGRGIPIFLFRRPHPGQRRLRIRLLLSANPPLTHGNREGQSALPFVVVYVLRCGVRLRRTTLFLLPLLSWGLSSLGLLPGSLSMKHEGRRGRRTATLHCLSSTGCGWGTASHRPQSRQRRPRRDLLQQRNPGSHHHAGH